VATLKDILADKSIKDDVVFTLASGQTTTIGELRALSAENQSALSKRETDLAAKEKAFQEQLKNLQLAQAETARLYKEVMEGKAKGGDEGRNNQPEDPFKGLNESDPVIGPLIKAHRSQQAAFEKLQRDVLAPLVNSQAQMARSYLEDRLEQMYMDLVPEAKRTEITYDGLLKAANDNKYVTRGGIPDLRRAYRDLTTKPMTQADIDAAVKAAEERGREAGRKEAAPRLPRPSANTGSVRLESPDGFRPKALTSVSAALDEALAAAAKDDSIWKSVDNLAN